MIKIINKKSEEPPKESTYHLYINEDFICEFKHNSKDGFKKCLEIAGEEGQNVLCDRYVNNVVIPALTAAAMETGVFKGNKNN